MVLIQKSIINKIKMNILDHFHSINPYSLNYTDEEKHLLKL